MLCVLYPCGLFNSLSDYIPHSDGVIDYLRSVNDFEEGCRVLIEFLLRNLPG